MRSFFDTKTLITQLQLSDKDNLLIYIFNQADENKKFELIKNQNVETIVRIAYHIENIEIFCGRVELKEHWEKIWCAYGVALSHQKNLPLILFFSQPQLNQFDLVRGAFFFHFSQEARKNMKKDFGFSEVESLKIAIQYRSVHAIQRYNEYLYHKIKKANPEESHLLFQELVSNSKRMLPQYGSYGYMVLAEAHGQNCIRLLNNHEIEKAEQEYKLVLEALDNATLILNESQYSIQNASLGFGLKYSNSWGFESPLQAKEFFIKYYEQTLDSMSFSDSAHSIKV